MYSASRHALGIYRAVVLTSRYTPAPSPPQLLSALSALIAAHPMLRVGILHATSNAASYAHIPHITLQNHVFEETMACEGEEEFNERLAGRQGALHDALWENIDTIPPWKIVVVRNEKRDDVDVMLGFHHSLMDGMSGIKFHSLLLTALNTTSADGAPSELHFPSPPVLPLSQEDAINFTFGPLFIASTLWGEFGPSFLKPAKSAIWAGEDVSFTRPYVTRILPFDISPEKTAILLSACRKHETTLTGLFHALSLAFFARTLGDAPGFAAATPVSLAKAPFKETDTPMDTFRVLVSNASHEFTAAEIAAMRTNTTNTDTPNTATDGGALDQAIWQTASRIRADLAASATNLTHNNIVAMLKHVPNWTAFHQNRDNKPRAETWAVSNVGAVPQSSSPPQTSPNTQDEPPNTQDESSEGGISISRVLFTNGALVHGAAVGVNVASAAGRVTVGLSWQEGVVQESLVREMREVMMNMVDAFCEAGIWTMDG